MRRNVTQLYILGTIRYDILTTLKRVHPSLLTACTVIVSAPAVAVAVNPLRPP